MRTVFLLIAVFFGGACWSDEVARWSESVQIFFVIEKSSAVAIISAADTALAPTGFTRTSTGTAYPGGLVKGIFASYKSGDLAMAMIVEGTREGCVVFSATNYDRVKAGLVSAAAESIKAKVSSSFGVNATFFSDSRCANAL